jgi:secondary thiamine-phosphate synthase enzyme
METLVPAPICHHGRIRVTTEQATEFIDLTARIVALANEAGIQAGLINIQTLHTTTAIVINEYEPLLLVDFGDLLARVAPKEVPYRHNDPNARTLPLPPGERPNAHSHCHALLLGSSASLNFADGRLQLGRWQRVFLVELDGPRTREVSVLVLGGGAK